MARSRRPELEKDNPVAPQMYIRRRKRTSPSQGASPSGPHDDAPIGEALQTLAEAAERFVNAVPRWKRVDADRQALLDAITRAELLLSVERLPAKRPTRSSREA